MASLAPKSTPTHETGQKGRGMSRVRRARPELTSRTKLCYHTLARQMFTNSGRLPFLSKLGTLFCRSYIYTISILALAPDSSTLFSGTRHIFDRNLVQYCVGPLASYGAHSIPLACFMFAPNPVDTMLCVDSRRRRPTCLQVTLSYLNGCAPRSHTSSNLVTV